MKIAKPGTVVSEGTLLPEDLVTNFAAALRALGSPCELPPLDGLEQDEVWMWVEALMDELQVHAPAGHYFGAHPGDGACFGFWEEEA